jgi:assimilatory nitrate reductase catalytic subunit
MIVCLCEGVSEKKVDQAIDSGARTVEAVGRMCGAGTGCGSCKPLVRDMLARQARAHACTHQPLEGTLAPAVATT